MKTVLFASGASLLAFLSVTPAIAGKEPAPIVRQIEVSHGDLDLATPAGAKAMLGRLERAATRACGGRPSRETNDGVWMAKMRAYRACRIAAVDNATVTLGAPLVRAAWLGREEAAGAAEARQRSAELFRAAGLAVPADLSR